MILLALAMLQVQEPIREQRLVMGSLCTIAVHAGDEKAARAAIARAFDAIKAADALLSDYRPESELSRLNAAGAMKCSAELRAFVKAAQEFGQESGGAFDVTIGPLMRLWGFRGGTPAFPAEAELKAVMARVGMSRVAIEGETVRLGEGMTLDPGGLGKGWAVDAAVKALKEAGITSALVDFGSTLYALGAPAGREAWVVGVRNPFKQDELLGTIAVKDASVSTSGNYEKFVDIDGRKYCHILDPRTGMPVDGVASVTVVGATGAETDFLSTSVFVLGAEKGLALASKRKADVFFVPVEGKPASTDGWRKRFVEAKD